ncbi:MAG: hypothetical protein ABUL44_00110, partial [Flavobacterium sp.]
KHTTMGLDTSHNAWHGPYSSFRYWREMIASKIGVNLQKMEGFNGDIPFSTLPENPINVLLDHSDCDGEIKWEDCGPLADALEQLLPQLNDHTHPLPNYYSDKTKQFIEGCRLAYSLQENIEFH